MGVELVPIPKAPKNWYGKSSIKAPGGLFDFGSSRGRLIREGGLLTKSIDKDISGIFSVLLSHILRNQLTILRL